MKKYLFLSFMLELIVTAGLGLINKTTAGIEIGGYYFFGIPFTFLITYPDGRTIEEIYPYLLLANWILWSFVTLAVVHVYKKLPVIIRHNFQK